MLCGQVKRATQHRLQLTADPLCARFARSISFGCN